MALINCSLCGKYISDKATTCPHCGSRVVPRVKCPECGTMVNSTASSCPNCGCPLNGKKAQPQKNKVSGSSTKPAPSKTSKVFTIIALAAGLIVPILIIMKSCRLREEAGNYYGNDYYENSETSIPEEDLSEDVNNYEESASTINETTEDSYSSSESSEYSESSSDKDIMLKISLINNVKKLVQAIKDEDEYKMKVYDEEIMSDYEKGSEEEMRKFVTKQFDEQCKKQNITDDLIMGYCPGLSCLSHLYK